MKLDTILVPVDFSEVSRQAIAYGVSLAGTFGGRLTALHVVASSARLPYIAEADANAIDKQRESDAHKHFERFLRRELAESMIERLVVSSGDPRDEILRFAEQEKTDLVVMGTHGRRGFERWILGSVTERILRKLPVPLLTVSMVERTSTAAVLAGGRVLYATDLSESAEQGLKVALELTQGLGAHLHVLHVMSPIQWDYGITYLPLDIAADHKRIRTELATRLEQSIPEEARRSGDVDWKLEEGFPREVILDTAERIDAGLIVINLHGRSREERSKLGRTAESVVRTAHRPVLSLPGRHFESSPPA